MCTRVGLLNVYAGNTKSFASKADEVVALKNNLLYDAAATPNLQLEIKLAKQWSLELGAGFNPFPLSDEKFPKWRHLSAGIAPRYWFCNVFNRGFISFNAAYAMYNVAGGVYPIGWIYPQVQNNRYEGQAVMGGVSGGWHFAISPHFGIELEGGVEAGYSWYSRYECKHCGALSETGGRWLVLPKLGVNLVVPLGGDEDSFARRCDCEKLDDAPARTVRTGGTPAQPVAKVEKEEPVEEPEPVQEPQPEPEPVVLEQPQELAVVEPVVPVEPLAPVAVVAAVEPKNEMMEALRHRLLRPESTYEPYDINVPLSADKRNVFLYFDVNVTKMDRNFIENDRLMDSIMFILGEALRDPSLRITRIQIVGFASFDGRLSYNERLAASRAETIKDYIRSVYPSLGDEVFTLCNGGESWAELTYHLERIDFDGKDDIVEIIEDEPNLDEREKLIKQYRNGGTYRFMRERLKRILRNLGCITIYYENVTK